jgi:hypothetical protein
VALCTGMQSRIGLFLSGRRPAAVALCCSRASHVLVPYSKYPTETETLKGPAGSSKRRKAGWPNSSWLAQGTKCFWREPVGQQKSAQRHKGIQILYAFFAESRLAPRTIER